MILCVCRPNSLGGERCNPVTACPEPVHVVDRPRVPVVVDMQHVPINLFDK
jgi:hypothetical protein